jgi:RNA-directed DNA polymerase
VGKAHDTGKAGTEGRSPHRQLLPDPVGSEHQKPTSLRGIANKAKADKRPRFRDLDRCVEAALRHDGWHDLHKEAARGVDQGTAEAEAANRPGNLEACVQRLQTKRYRTKLGRRCDLPKANGTERPLGIPALEDKLVQLACAKLLTAISEQDVLDGSYGYRAGRGALEAVRARTCDRHYGRDGDLVAAASQGCFEHLDHPWLWDMWRRRLDDRAVLHLRRQGLKAGMLATEGQVVQPATGTPQGGTVSPGRAHVSRHYALDRWFEKVVQPPWRGEALLCRYAEDWVCAFRFQEDAERVFGVRPTRLAKFHLHVAPENTQRYRFRRFHPRTTRRFTFLGCEFCWPPDRHGGPRGRRRTARQKLHAACQRLAEWSNQHRPLPGRAFFQRLHARFRGHYNYSGVRGNARSLPRFFQWAMDCTVKWRTRRGGQRRSETWEPFTHVLDRVKIARPRITEVPPRRVWA